MNKKFGPKYFLINLLDNSTVMEASNYGLFLQMLTVEGIHVTTQLMLDLEQYGVDDVV